MEGEKDSPGTSLSRIDGSLDSMPGPPGLPVVGNLFTYARDPLGSQLRWVAEYGDLVRYRLGGQDIVLTTDPEIVRDVYTTSADRFEKGRALKAATRIVGNGLLTSEGEEHMRARRTLAPLFQPKELPRYVATMVEETKRRAGTLVEGSVVDVAEELGALALSIIARVLFHGDVASETEKIGVALEDGLRLVARLSVPMYRYFEWLPLPAHLRFRRAKRYLDELVYAQIAARRADTDRPDDLLTRLLAAQDEEGDGGRLTDAQVRDEVMTLFLAGHETTANGLAWTLYLLAEHPEIEEKVAAEIERVTGGADPTPESVAELTFLRQVVNESLRLLPPVWNTARLVVKEYACRDWVLPEGTVVILSPYTSHRQAAFWDDPDRFDPTRFEEEAAVKRAQRHRYFPFGGGRRICIGEHFAILEMVTILAVLLSGRRFERATDGPIGMIPTITIRPRGGLPMRVLGRRRQER
jgi:cytochrome P450